MHLKTSKSNGRPYLSIVQGYRDPVTKKVRHRTIKSLGYIDVLEKEFPDPISHFNKVVAEMNKKVAEETANRKNIGYAALSKIYHELSLHAFFSNHSRKFKSEYNLNNIMKLLIFSRILRPASKKKTYEEKDRYFENTDFSLDDVY
ncbi:MAG: hypothetical protein Q7I98_09195, partial [Erysipelotrichaceae bacterium]|nr:hypothetical protein [Erysipelotrichaceae bacterium]